MSNVCIAIMTIPLITMFMGGKNHQKWVTYDMAIPTLDMNVNMWCNSFAPENFLLDGGKSWHFLSPRGTAGRELTRLTLW